MHILKIRLAKIKTTLKQSGFKNGFKKLWQDGKLFLKGWLAYKKNGQVLLISGGVGDSARYRTFNVAEDLNLKNISALAVNQSNLFLKFLIKNFSVIVFHHRVIKNKKLKWLIQLAKQERKKIIFDLDDLVLSQEQWKKTEYYQQASLAERKQYQAGIGEYFFQEILPDYVTVSTTYLKNIIQQFYNKPVQTIFNKINLEEIKWAKNIREEKNIKRKKQFQEEIKIGYFSGTLSHNQDFATIIPVLTKVLKDYSFVKLFLVGPLDVKNEFIQNFSSQIYQFSFVPRKEHFQNLSQIDINLIPLRLGDAFCEAKSAIKFMEAGLVEVPSIATATQTFQEVIQNNQNGFLAYSLDDWEKYLRQLIKSNQLRNEIGKNALKTVLTKHIVGKKSYYEDDVSFYLGK